MSVIIYTITYIKSYKHAGDNKVTTVTMVLLISYRSLHNGRDPERKFT